MSERNPTQGIQFLKPRTVSQEAARKDASHLPEVLNAARRLVDSIAILKFTSRTLFEVDPEAQFGIEYPLMEALDARGTIEARELPNLTGATRTGWIKLVLAVTESTHRPSGQWTFDGIEAALNQLEAAYRQEFGTLPESSPAPGDVSKADYSGADPLPQRALLAHRAYTFAEQQLERACTDDEAYRWLRENHAEDFELPKLKTWKRYLRVAREQLNQRKYNRRAGRTGRSIATPDHLDRHSGG